MTSYELAEKLKEKIRVERVAINDVLKLISMALETRAYVELGFSSMFDWLTREFGYSNAAAQRRIEAARMIKAVPEAALSLETGVVNLTTLSQAQTVIRAQEKISGQKISSVQKAQVVESAKRPNAYWFHFSLKRRRLFIKSVELWSTKPPLVI